MNAPDFREAWLRYGGWIFTASDLSARLGRSPGW
jgi:hypothetical protein